MKHKKILIAGGGTGGHIVPALTIAKELKCIDSSLQVEFVSGSSELEKTLYSQSNFICHSLSVGRLRKNVSRKERVKTFFSLPFVLLKALYLVTKLKPTLILGMGGAVSGPVLLAGAFLRKKTIIFEPNALPGLSNRWLFPFVSAGIVVFKSAGKYFTSKKYVYRGSRSKKIVHLPYPVRSQMSQITLKSQPDDPLRVLILGGSQGSSLINRVFCELITEFSRREENKKAFSFAHQTGKKDFAQMQKLYTDFKNVQVFPFSHQIHEFYEWADIVVGRAGTGTLAEISATGRAGILVPLAHSADQHQLKNAQDLLKKSAVIVIEEKDFCLATLKKVLTDLSDKPQEVSRLSTRIRELKLGLGLATPGSIASWLYKTLS